MCGGGEGGWRGRGKRSGRRGRIAGLSAGAGLSQNQTDAYQQEQSESFFCLFHEAQLSGSSPFNATHASFIFKIRIDGPGLEAVAYAKGAMESDCYNPAVPGAVLYHVLRQPAAK